MSSVSLVFPQELELVMDVISSPVLAAATEVSDTNTCGVAVAEAFNMMKVSNLAYYNVLFIHIYVELRYSCFLQEFLMEQMVIAKALFFFNLCPPVYQHQQCSCIPEPYQVE